MAGGALVNQRPQVGLPRLRLIRCWQQASGCGYGARNGA
jgi:hypothetical protein